MCICVCECIYISYVNVYTSHLIPNTCVCMCACVCMCRPMVKAAGALRYLLPLLESKFGPTRWNVRQASPFSNESTHLD